MFVSICRARDANIGEIQERKPRRRGLPADGTHPLLGNAPTLALMRAEGGNDTVDESGDNEVAWWNPFAKPTGPSTTIPQRLEPKTFLASERTFLSWLHMAITLASIAAALIAFASTSHKSEDKMHMVRKKERNVFFIINSNVFIL